LSEDRQSIVTFATAGLLIASILIFSLVALPELLPAIYPQLRHGTVATRIVSTSGSIVGNLGISNIEVTVASMQLHRVGVGEGTWVAVIRAALSVEPIVIAQQPLRLGNIEVPIGDYNLMKISLGNLTATIRGRNVTLSGPMQDLKVPAVFTVDEGKLTSLVVDLSFNEGAVATAKQFDPYITVTIEQPGHAPLSTIASMKPLASVGPDTLGSGESKSFTFTVAPAAVEGYLVHAQGGLGVQNTFDLGINETGEFWYGLTGNVWLLGGNLTSGTYHMNVRASPGAITSVSFIVDLYRVPRIPEDLPDASFSGLVPGEPSQPIRVNEFALHLDQAGTYDFYLSAKIADYEFLVDNNPESIVSGDRMVTLQLQSGLHTFQIFTDFSGSGRDTSWSVGVVLAPTEAVHPLSSEAILSTSLLVVAALLFVVDLSIRQLRRRSLEKKAMRLVEMSLST
jgi:hypothetical protein